MAAPYIEISGQYKYKGRGPLDAKAVVETYDDLKRVATWHNKEETNTAYNGMVVSVWRDTSGEASESGVKNGVYYLHDSKAKTIYTAPDVTQDSNWHKLSTLADLQETAASLVQDIKKNSDVIAVLTGDTADSIDRKIIRAIAPLATSEALSEVKTSVEQINADLLLKANTAEVVSNAIFTDFCTTVTVAIADKANRADVYSKAELNATIAAIGETLETKADTAEVYTKEDAKLLFVTHDAIDDKIDALVANAARVTAVEGIQDLASLVTCVGNTASAVAEVVDTLEANTTKLDELESTLAAYEEALDTVKVLKPSDEVTMTEDGTLGIGSVNVDKLVQDDTIILDCGEIIS